VWPDAVVELRRASQALTARWRREDAPEPPPPSLPAEPAESDQQRAAREHHELLEAARPWARVTHRPYDAELCGRLMKATAAVAALPDIPSLLTTGVDTTGRLAAKVARNADDETFRQLIARAATQQPLAAAVALLRGLIATAKDAGRPALKAKAVASATKLLAAQSWQDPRIWTDNRPHMRKLLGWTASVTSDSDVRMTLTTAINQDPQLLPAVLLGMAQWIEQHDATAFGKILNLTSRIETLLPWFPPRPSPPQSDETFRTSSQPARSTAPGTTTTSTDWRPKFYGWPSHSCPPISNAASHLTPTGYAIGGRRWSNRLGIGFKVKAIRSK
jgi:hypothetical protein